jgi:sugar phosphate isomerase/epimerase
VNRVPISVSAMLTSLPLDLEAAVRRASALGFHQVDVVALADRPAAHLEALADTGLGVCCAAVGRGLPDGHNLDAASIDDRQAAVEGVKRQLADAARLGATRCYVVPGTDASAAGLARFAESCRLLADYAGGRMVRLCVEHMPGRALPSAAAVLTWLEELDHANLALLLDVGHCLLSHEDAQAVVVQAGSRLGYVHFNDNDGVADLHLPLLAGELTEAALAGVLGTLRTGRYEGPVALELNPQNDDPEGALADGKELLERLARATAPVQER